MIFGLVTPRFINEPQSVEEFIGDPVELVCTAEGFPAPEITWFFNDTMIFANDTMNETMIMTNMNITNTESTLMISEVELNDGGSYTCQINSVAISMPMSSSGAIVAVLGGKIH